MSEDLLEMVVETKYAVANIPAGEQLIIRRMIARTVDPLYECEYKGRSACVHLSDIALLGKWETGREETH